MKAGIETHREESLDIAERFINDSFPNRKVESFISRVLRMWLFGMSGGS